MSLYDPHLTTFLRERQSRADADWNRTLRRAEERLSEKREAAAALQRREAKASAEAAAGRKASGEAAAAVERQRIEEILTSEAGHRSPSLAQRLAFEGELSSADAIRLLEAAPGDANSNPDPRAFAHAIILAGKKRRGEAPIDSPAPAARHREVEASAGDILAAAELARSGGRQPAPPPKDSLADQIIKAGKNRRGES